MFYLDLFRALDRENVRYVLIGGLTLNIHGVERATMDIDLVPYPYTQPILRLKGPGSISRKVGAGEKVKAEQKTTIFKV